MKAFLLQSCLILLGMAGWTMCMPSLSGQEIAGGIEIIRSTSKSIMVLPVQALESGDSKASGRHDLVFYMPVENTQYPFLKFQPSLEKGKIRLRIFGITEKVSGPDFNALSSDGATLLETHDLDPEGKMKVILPRAAKLAKESIVIRVLDKDEAARRLTIPESVGEKRATSISCQGNLVNASFSPQVRLRDALFFIPRIGCAICGTTTVCPNPGKCIETACGSVCN